MESNLTRHRVADVLFEMRNRGIKIWMEDSELRYLANRGTFTSADRATLLAHKTEIIAFLRNTAELKPIAAPLTPRPSSLKVVPLMPFQLWMWRQMSQTISKHSVVAVRICGPINFQLLRLTFQDLVSRHEALRTGIVFMNGNPQQEIRETPSTVLKSVELPNIRASDRWRKVKSLIEELANQTVDFSMDTLFDARLIELEYQECVLVMRINSLISDATSRRVLWQDIWDIYSTHSRASPLSLRKILQPADLAVWHEDSESLWTREHDGYWENRLRGAERVHLFSTSTATHRGGVRSWGFELKDVCADLRTFSRRQRTSLGMVILTVWIASIMRWCGKTDLVVSFLTTGRIHAEVQNSIGCFMCLLFLRINIQRTDSLDSLLKHVVEEYDRAYQHHDFGRVISRTLEADFTRNPGLNWMPRGFSPSVADLLREGANQDGISGALSVQPLEFRAPALPDADWSSMEPGFALMESEDGIKGAMIGSASLSTMRFERFVENLRIFANYMVQRPQIPVFEVPCSLQ